MHKNNRNIKTMSDHTYISATKPDWSRERLHSGCYEPWKRLLLTIRRYQYLKGRGGAAARLLLPWVVIRYRFWSAVCGADIPLNARLGGGLLLPHPNGIVIHPEAEIGPNCLIFQQVTIGVGVRPGLPRIGGHVDIGAGAKLLGGIRIGDHARIGANAVVICDVPEQATAVGIPAKILPPQAGYAHEQS
jgi:serine O-acetyltransferase